MILCDGNFGMGAYPRKAGEPSSVDVYNERQKIMYTTMKHSNIMIHSLLEGRKVRKVTRK